MKRFLPLLCTILLYTSCEDVIDVDLNTMEPRLVIDATIAILEPEGSLSESTIKLSTTTPYFEDSFSPINDAEVSIFDEEGTIIPFGLSENGHYNSYFVPEENKNYTLEVIYKNAVYRATTSLINVPTLEYVEQKDNGGFLGKNIELKAFFTDPEDEENFYYSTANSMHGIRRDVLKDEFFNGNSIFTFYSHEDLAPGDKVDFHLYGVTESFYNYMYLLLEQTGGGGPFGTQPATVRGNIINESNPDDFAFGYFRLSKVSKLTYIVQ